jgi:glycosyltransferase involved in cell wall biosynthesis
MVDFKDFGMPNKSLTLTLVIPVYNEENYLPACLESVKRQTVMPDEVLVVDNNSTDRSLQIAQKYDFVKILHEKRQHQVFAQANGFNHAKSDILGRIDADSVLPTDWVKKVKAAFNDHEVAGVTGGARPYDAPAAWAMLAGFNWYLFMVRLIVGHRMLWGANCAIRKSVWQKVKHDILMRSDIWEDYDLSFCLSRWGEILYLRQNKVGASFRAVHTSFTGHANYQFRAIKTFFFRATPLQFVLFCLLWVTDMMAYPFMALDDWLQRRQAKV